MRVRGRCEPFDEYRRKVEGWRKLSASEMRNLFERYVEIKNVLTELQTERLVEDILSSDDGRNEEKSSKGLLEEEISRLASEMDEIRQILAKNSQFLVLQVVLESLKSSNVDFDPMELVTFLNIKLMERIDRYDPHHKSGSSFENYVRKVFKGVVKDFFKLKTHEDHDAGKLGSIKSFYKIQGEIKELQERLGRAITPEEIKEYVGERGYRKYVMDRFWMDLVSFSSQLEEGDEDKRTYEDVIGVEDFSEELARSMDMEKMRRCLDRLVWEVLDEMERDVVFCRYRLALSLDKIAKLKGKSKEAIRQILIKSLRKLKSAIANCLSF